MKLAVFVILALTFTSITCQQPEGYTQVELDDFYNDVLLQNLVDFGSQYVIDKGIEVGNLPDTEYYITQIYSIYKSGLVEDKEDYAFDVMIVDLDGSAIRANFIVRHSPSSNTQEVVSSAYDEAYYFDDLLIEGENPEDELLSEAVSVNATLEGATSEFDLLGDIWFSEDDIIDNKGNIVLGAPVSLSLSQFTSNDDVQNLFVFGLEDVLEEIAPQEIAISQFHITNLYNITKQVVNGINYVFDAEVESTSGVKIRVNFEVYSQSWTGVVEVLSYSYQMTNSDGTIATGEENFVGL